MTQLKLEEWPIEKLIGYARNPRKNDHVVDKMVEALKEFGFRIPVVAKSDGTVVDGHLRLKAAHKIGLKTVPVVLADELTDAQVKAFRILANRSVNWAEWDQDLLKLEFEELKAEGFNLDLTGFSLDEVNASLNPAPAGNKGNGDPDDIPEPPKEAKVKRGELWLLGAFFECEKCHKTYEYEVGKTMKECPCG